MIRPVVFAAGLGTRMGTSKALMPIEGAAALTVVLDTIYACGLQRPIVVLGNDADAVRLGVRLETCLVVVNTQPDRGLSGSMKLAMDALENEDTGILIFHVDMPYVAISSVLAVMKAIDQGASLAAPFYGDVRGFPVFFHRCHFEPLRESLNGDSGGRRFLNQHSSDLVGIPVQDPGCVFDIDCPSDLRAWKGAHLCATNE